MGRRSIQLNRWFETKLGQHVLQTETQVMHTLLPPHFGYHLVQLGSVGQGCLINNSRIMHRCIVSQSLMHPQTGFSYVQAALDNLPFAEESIDLIVLPHILEFEADPHRILHHVTRSLIPDGHVIIIGFNPFSVWGIWRKLFAQKYSAPWSGQFLSSVRINDWLKLLGLEPIQQHSFFFSLPFHHPQSSRYTPLLERIGKRCAGRFGAVYIIVAQKRTLPLTLITPKWRIKETTFAPTGVSSTHYKK